MNLFERTWTELHPIFNVGIQEYTIDPNFPHSIQSGPSATYTYYPDGSLNTIVWTPVAGTFKYRYTLPGQYQSVTLPSGATRNFTYDDQSRLTNLTNLASGGANLATYAYGYDFNYTTGQSTMLGQRTSMTATVPSQSLNNHLFKYEYDGLYELNKATYPNVAPFNAEVDSWTYDGIGNRLTSTVNGVTANYTYQKIGANPLNWQRLTSDGASAYTYDSNGNTQTRTGATFTWNYDDRMTGVTGTSSYVYDYQGRRSKKTVGASTSTYLYNGLNLIRETTGGTTADYLFGPGIDEPLAMSRSGSIYYYVVDGLGSVTEVTTSSGGVQNNYVYDAWGQVRNTCLCSLASPFRYTAREIGEAGTLFYRARYYQTGIGRFLQEDPLGYDAGINLYSYVYGDPVAATDPLGLFPICTSPFPDSFWDTYDFTDACTQHDKCYGTCGRSRMDCDLKFRMDMGAECARRNFARWNCLRAADVHYIGVYWLGGSFYEEAQAASGCLPCASPPPPPPMPVLPSP